MSGSQSSATQMVGKYLASKGLPMTGENVRRALEMNASNPGVIPGLTNQSPPPPDAPQTSMSSGAAKRQPALQTQGGTHEVGSGVKATTPRAAITSDSAQPQQPQQVQGQDSGLLKTIAQLILGGGAVGGAGYGLSNLLGRFGGGGAQPTAPVAEPMRIGGPAELPAPAQLGVEGPSAPLQISDRNMVGEGVAPVGSPQPGRMEPGPSTPVPPTGRPVETPAQINMPQNTGQSSIRSGAPVSPTVAGAGVPTTPMELPQGINWSKVLGEAAQGVGKVVRR